jgi:(p)ppGpp synthase/HD superfamily hydrolase
MSITVKQARDLAEKAHDGQYDKQGQPYIEHVLRVMRSVQGDDARVVALLHDILEDTRTDTHDLRSAGCTEKQIEALLLLTRTHVKGETYQGYIRRLSVNPLAVQVKLADLRDNLGRIDGLLPEDQERLRPRYDAALKFLTSR